MRNHIYRATYRPPAAVSTQPWTPAAVTTELWLDAADAATITLTDGAVSRWADKSGLGRDATQSYPEPRPTVAAASVGGEDSILFDAVDDGMETGLNLELPGYVIAVCAKCNTDAGQTRLIQSDDYNCIIHPTRRDNNVYVEGLVHGGAFDSQGQAGITVLYGAAPGTYSLRSNGSGVPVSGVNTRAWGRLNLGAAGSYSEPAGANICEIVVLYTVDTNTIQRIEGYLAHKWGIASRLPDGHPHKATPPMLPIVLYDGDALAYIDAVEAADGQALERGVKIAISDFVSGCKQDGIWNSISACCLLAGARTLDGALTPLKGAGATNFNFVAGDYDRKTGLLGAITGLKHLDTNVRNDALPMDTRHLAVYATSAGTDLGLNNTYIGSVSSDGAGRSDIEAQDGGTKLNFYASSINSSLRITRSGATGFFGVSRSSSTSISARAGGSTTSADIASTTPYNGRILVFCRDYGDFVDSNIDARMSFFSVGLSVDLALLDARVASLMNALNSVIP